MTHPLVGSYDPEPLALGEEEVATAQGSGPPVQVEDAVGSEESRLAGGGEEPARHPATSTPVPSTPVHRTRWNL